MDTSWSRSKGGPKRKNNRKPIRKRQLKKKLSPIKEVAAVMPSTIEELKKFKQMEHEENKEKHPQPTVGSKLKLMPFRLPPGNKQKPGSPARNPKKGRSSKN